MFQSSSTICQSIPGIYKKLHNGSEDPFDVNQILSKRSCGMDEDHTLRNWVGKKSLVGGFKFQAECGLASL